MYDHKHRIEWSIEDAEIHLGQQTKLYGCDLRINCERDIMEHSVQNNWVGELTLSHPVPESVWFEESGVPRMLDVIATNGETRIWIEGFLAGDRPNDENTFGFLALRAEKTESS